MVDQVELNRVALKVVRNPRAQLIRMLLPRVFKWEPRVVFCSLLHAYISALFALWLSVFDETITNLFAEFRFLFFFLGRRVLTISPPVAINGTEGLMRFLVLTQNALRMVFVLIPVHVDVKNVETGMILYSCDGRGRLLDILEKCILGRHASKSLSTL